MAVKTEDKPAKPPASYWVYIVQCADTSLYCGIAIDVQARLEQHNSSKLGARYTKSRRPVKLVYQAKCGTRSKAQQEEFRIKKLSRAEKELLIARQSAGTLNE